MRVDSNKQEALGVYLLRIDTDSEQAKAQLQKVGLSDGGSTNFEWLTSSYLSINPASFVFHGKVYKGDVLYSDEEMNKFGIGLDTPLPIRPLSKIVKEHEEQERMLHSTPNIAEGQNQKRQAALSQKLPPKKTNKGHKL